MKQITSQQFKEAILLDPAWASKLTEPVEITDFCDMGSTQITHLSPFLHFTGKNKAGAVAAFNDCQIKRATGTFHGFVSFCHSEIEKIENLVITEVDTYGNAADFSYCANLEIATGTYPGAVDFEETGVHKIEALHIEKANSVNVAAIFDSCYNLKIATGTYSGMVSFRSSSIEKIDPKNLIILNGDKEVGYADFSDCQKLKVLEGHFNGLIRCGQSKIETVNSKNFSIKGRPKDPEDSHMIELWKTPLEDNPEELKKLIRCITKGLSLSELKMIQEVHLSQTKLVDAIEKEMGRFKNEAKKKEKGIEFDID